MLKFGANPTIPIPPPRGGGGVFCPLSNSLCGISLSLGFYDKHNLSTTDCLANGVIKLEYSKILPDYHRNFAAFNVVPIER